MKSPARSPKESHWSKIVVRGEVVGEIEVKKMMENKVGNMVKRKDQKRGRCN